MNRILIIAAAVSALSVSGLAGSALAQDAYTASQGAAPSDYPPCTQKGQDRCTQTHGGMKGHKARHHMKKAAKADTQTSKDGERG